MTADAAIAPPRYDLAGAAHDYPVRSGPPKRSVLVCSHQRSGSTMLGEALYFAGGLGCPLEYLHAGFRPGFERRWGVTGLRSLTHATWRHRTDPDGTLSIKLFWADVIDIVDELAPGAFPDLRAIPAADMSAATYRDLNVLLGELFPNPVHIHLKRNDALRQAVSWFTAINTNSWRRIPLVEGDDAAGTVAYDADVIAGLMQTTLFCHEHWAAFFAANGIVPLALSYEALVADYAGTVERLLAALGRPGSAPPVRMERQSTAQSEALMRRFLHDQRPARRR